MNHFSIYVFTQNIVNFIIDKNNIKDKKIKHPTENYGVEFVVMTLVGTCIYTLYVMNLFLININLKSISFI